MGMNNSIVELQKLNVVATYEKKKHYNAAERYRKYYNRLQTAVIVIGVLNGSALITLLKLGVVGFAYVSAGLSLLVAVLNGIQKAGKFDQATERNRDVGDQFLLLTKEIGMTVAIYNDTGNQIRFETEGKNLVERYGEIVAMAKNAPTSKKDYDTARSGIINGEENYTASDMGVGQTS